jgi:hypothetical protein
MLEPIWITPEGSDAEKPHPSSERFPLSIEITHLISRKIAISASHSFDLTQHRFQHPMMVPLQPFVPARVEPVTRAV